MSEFDGVLHAAASAAAAAVLVRAACMVNRMRIRHDCWLLQLAYIVLGIFSFAVALSPLYRDQSALAGYSGFVISAAAVLILDRRLRKRPRHDHH